MNSSEFAIARPTDVGRESTSEGSRKHARVHSVCPYIGKNWPLGNSSRNRRRCAGGMAAAALVTYRSDDRSTSLTGHIWISLANIVGTPGNPVTRAAAARLSTSTGKANDFSTSSEY